MILSAPIMALAETALRFNLSNPNIDCTVVGLIEMSHLEQVINAVKAGLFPMMH